MKKVKSVRIKPIFAFMLKLLGFMLFIALCVFIFYRKQISDLEKIGYSEVASKEILFTKHKNYVMSVGENKVLNIAFENKTYVEKYLDNYVKIKYVEHEHIVENINKLLDKGYSNNDINIIFKHGDDNSVSEFAKRDRVRYLEEFFSYDFAKLENYDRYVNYSDETGEDEFDTVVIINLDLDKEDYVDSVTVDDFSIDMLVNKHHGLSEDFLPDDLVSIDGKYTDVDDLKCSKVALDALIKMFDQASSEGYALKINSAYRSYQDQLDLEDTYRMLYGQSYVDKYVAKPGYSEHQTGLAFDIGSRYSSIFADSREYLWMLDNAYKYGFILRFDSRYEDLTEFRNEPWHFRYVGVDIAKYIYEHSNMSLEEYYVLFLDK